MNFYQEVYRLVRQIPAGKIATYGSIAAAISTPRAARVVGFALRALPENSDVPWQRVIAASGTISIENMEHPAEEQAQLLQREGVEVALRDGVYHIDLQKYFWDTFVIQ